MYAGTGRGTLSSNAGHSKTNKHRMKRQGVRKEASSWAVFYSQMWFTFRTLEAGVGKSQQSCLALRLLSVEGLVQKAVSSLFTSSLLCSSMRPPPLLQLALDLEVFVGLEPLGLTVALHRFHHWPRTP